MKEEFSIRKYLSEDRFGIISLFRLNTPEYFAVEEEKDLLYYLENHSDDYFVMVTNKEIIGCGGINYSEDKKMGTLSWDLFHPAYQKKGCGTKLTNFRIEKIRTSKEIKIISVRTSQQAFQFYEKCGFQLKEIIIDYWAKGFDLYRMEFEI
ncbi:hypothetical protein BH11BAC2_BH11BAC2_02490 [soil metagenome]